ncbi:hypothetical protein FXO38_16233 [Capsicum annuum]|nr:hypothetical protein FXO38_16233 [Capsicum annuum]KAF3654183.1 hypothetical protein FXO37_16622 [Capsicum annuum]
MTTITNQRPWLAQILTDDGNPSWIQGKDQIVMSSLSSSEKFWRTIVRLRLMHTEEDANLDNQRAVLVVSMIEGLNTDFGQIIGDKIFVRAHKIASALSFPCLIIELCWQVNVPIIRGVDNEIWASRKQDIERTQHESKFDMRVHKPPVYETQTVPTPEATDVPSGMSLPLVTYVLHGTSAGSRFVPLIGDTLDTTSIPPIYSKYRLTQENFARMVKA